MIPYWLQSLWDVIFIISKVLLAVSIVVRIPNMRQAGEDVCGGEHWHCYIVDLNSMTHYFKCYGCENVTGLRSTSQICNPRIWKSETERLSLSVRSVLATKWDPSVSTNRPKNIYQKRHLALWADARVHHVQEPFFRKMYISISMTCNHSSII